MNENFYSNIILLNDIALLFDLSKTSMNIVIGYRRFIHTNYSHIIENNYKIIDLSYHDEISKKFCEFCLLNKHEISVFYIFMKKTDEFLNKIHVNIEKSLPLIFKKNQYFLLIKNDASGMFFVRFMKIKNQIFDLLKNFGTGIEIQKSKFIIKCIKSEAKLNNHGFKQGFKKTEIQGKQFLSRFELGLTLISLVTWHSPINLRALTLAKHSEPCGISKRIRLLWKMMMKENHSEYPNEKKLYIFDLCVHLFWVFFFILIF